jgi:hypothetical protein
VKVTAREQNSVALSFEASELLVIVNALELAAGAAGPTMEATVKQVQRPLVDALRYLRPKAHVVDGWWTTDWARGDDGKHL